MTATYLAIDMGYLFFYRYHATKMWYRKAKEYIDDLSMAEDMEFQNKFKDMIESCIQKLLKKYKTNWENVFLCRDCRRGEIWRNDIHNEYKGTRDTSKLTGLSIAAKLLKEKSFDLVRYKGVKCIGVKTAEG